MDYYCYYYKGTMVENRNVIMQAQLYNGLWDRC